MRLIVLLLMALALGGCDRERAREQQAEQAGARVPAKGLDRSHRGKSVPDVTFRDPGGDEISLADFQGVPVLVNLWATWCAPCVKELPTLDRLAAKYERDGSLGIVTVSQDRAPQSSVVAFLDQLGTGRLGSYHDPEMKLSGAFKADVLPTTILIDAQGREIWRYVGDLNWTGEEAARLLAEAKSAKP